MMPDIKLLLLICVSNTLATQFGNGYIGNSANIGHGGAQQQLQSIPDISHFGHTYPKLGLLDLGQISHGEVSPETIKITSVVGIKVPAPYPVKVPHKVPYPVAVHKPYPVPVPQIVKVPHPVPYEVIKKVNVPVEVTKQIAVPHPVPYPVPVAVPTGHSGGFHGGIGYNHGEGSAIQGNYETPSYQSGYGNEGIGHIQADLGNTGYAQNIGYGDQGIGQQQIGDLNVVHGNAADSGYGSEQQGSYGGDYSQIAQNDQYNTLANIENNIKENIAGAEQGHNSYEVPVQNNYQVNEQWSEHGQQADASGGYDYNAQQH